MASGLHELQNSCKPEANYRDLRVTPVRFYDLHSDARQFKSHRPMNLQHANLTRLDVQYRDLRDICTPYWNPASRLMIENSERTGQVIEKAHCIILAHISGSVPR